MTYDIIGTIYNVDNTDPENPVVTPLPGFHINTTSPIEGLEQYVVEPVTPRRVFAGAGTYCYMFESEAQAQELLPEAFPATEGEEV